MQRRDRESSVAVVARGAEVAVVARVVGVAVVAGGARVAIVARVMGSLIQGEQSPSRN